MPLKVNVGLARKVGEPNYSSRGASVNVEMELDSSLVNEPGKLQERIRQLFGVVRTTLADELNGHQHPPTQQSANTDSRPHTSGNGNGNGNGANHSNGQRSNGQRPRPATQSQAKAIYAIARSQNVDLVQFLHDRFQVERPEDLTIKEASTAIDAMKAAENAEGGRR